VKSTVVMQCVYNCTGA